MFNKRIVLAFAAFAVIFLTLLASYFYTISAHKNVKPDEISMLQTQQSLGFVGVDANPNSQYNFLPDAHLSFKWMNTEAVPLEQQWLVIIKSKKNTLIRIETWAGSQEDPQHVNVLEDLGDGKYDHKIKQLCADLAPVQHQVLLTLDPEMEVPVKDFPWQYQSPKVYIQAFRHFYKVVKSVNPNLSVIWSSAGYPGADEYWPGQDAADALSISVHSYSESKTTAYPASDNLQTAIRRKMFRMRMMNKPQIILLSQATPKSAASKEDFEKAKTIYLKEAESLGTAAIQNTDKLSALVNDHKLLIGAYDPKKLLINEKQLTTEHFFADWGSVEDGSLKRLINEANRRKHNIIVTMEPWRGIKWPTDPKVLEKINDGFYDPIIRKTANVISSAKYSLFLRFAQEMEIPITRYAWQSQDPVSYIKAYRHFMSFFRNQKNLKMIWGPAGDRGSLEWYPGDQWVDYISIAIYGLPDVNITDPRKQESFSTIFNRKSYRMRLVTKPLFIAEFGVKGPANFQKAWLLDAAATIKNNKNIVGISYFNLADNPKVWGKMPPPNWGISKSTFQAFSSKLD
jgi:beta-mannanase